MPRRVVDQDQDRLLDPLWIDLQEPFAVDLGRQAGCPLPRQHLGRLDQPRDQPAGRHVLLLQRRRAGVGAGQEEQVVDQLAHPAAPRGDRGQRRGVEPIVFLGESGLGVAEDHGQRRAQLVRGVGDEVGLGLQGARQLRAGSAARARTRARSRASTRPADRASITPISSAPAISPERIDLLGPRGALDARQRVIGQPVTQGRRFRSAASPICRQSGEPDVAGGLEGARVGRRRVDAGRKSA